MQISDIKHHAPLGKSDHNVITFNFNCYVDYSKPKDTYNYAKGDYDAMRKQLTDTGWSNEYVAKIADRDVEENWFILKTKLLKLRDDFIPLNKAPTKPT